MRAAVPRWFVWVLALTVAIAAESRGASLRKKLKKPFDEGEATRGERLFLRMWTPDDPRARGGDGLGPVFNARSCVACHGLARPGGGGTNAVNVELLSAVPTRSTRGSNAAEVKPLDRNPLIAVHPGFALSNSIVLHRFGLAPNYQAWRKFAPLAFDRQARGTTGPFAGLLDVGVGLSRIDFRLVTSARNTPALFGAGRIDTIPDAVIEAEERRQTGKPVHGRVSRLKGGQIGRFGWKAQVSGLDDFVLTACANEMGLEVPGHHQAADRFGYGERDQPGLDMAENDCRLLVGYVASLPAPEERSSPIVERGRALFARTGCADCHRPNLGGVEGIYSDLLLHDMGPELSDAGVYYGEEDSSPGVPKTPDWRTPPLWGVADSAPYLHDGRADTLAEAIGLHGGEAQHSVHLYNTLEKTQKVALLGFLRALKVPTSARLVNRAIRLADEEFLPFERPPLPLAAARSQGIGLRTPGARMAWPFTVP